MCALFALQGDAKPAEGDKKETDKDKNDKEKEKEKEREKEKEKEKERARKKEEEKKKLVTDTKLLLAFRCAHACFYGTQGCDTHARPGCLQGL